MADEQQTFEEMLRSYNLTSEEKARVEEQQGKKPFTADTLKDFILKMRTENAKEVAQRKDGKINYDELQVAWETVKDAKQGDDLYNTKVALQEKSEIAMQNVAPELDMATAPEISEWLKINNSLGNDANKQRNEQLAGRLNAFYQQYDNDNGLGSVSPETAELIAKNQKQLEADYGDFDPFAEANGLIKDEQFANSKVFYDNLKIENKDPNSDEVDKEQYKKDMLALAKREAIAALSVQPNFYQLPKEERDSLFKASVAQFLEEGCVSILVSDMTAQLAQRADTSPKPSSKELRAQASAIMKGFAKNPKQAIVSNSAANGAYAARLQQQVNFEKRIAQKSDVRGLWGKIKAVKKNFEQKHPKTAGVLKVLGNLGLTIGVNVVSGPAGLAALSAIRLYKAGRDAAKDLAKEGRKANVFNTVGYMFKSSKYRQKLLGSTVGIAFAAVGIGTGGLDANGLIGQGLSHGWGHAVDSLSNMAGGVWNGLTHPVAALKSTFGDGNLLNTAKSFALPKDGLRIARLSATLGTFADRMGTKIYEAKKQGKKFAWGSALLDAAITAGTVAMTSHVHDTGDVAPDPTPTPEPEPTPAPEPAPTPVNPHPAPHPAPAPETTPTPAPETTPTPAPETTPTPETTPEETPEEQTRDETYYQEEKDALTPEGEKSLKKEINIARKEDGYTIEDAIETNIDNQVEDGALSQQQGEELTNYVKSELDAADGTTDGEIKDEDISRGDVRRAMNRVEDTLDSMKNNADEVLLAENLENIPEFTDTPAESFSHDTRTSEFYKGMSDTIDKMQNGEAPLSKAMSAAIKNGELSPEQATVMNTRYSELRAEGHDINETLDIMKKDYLNEQKYWAAQTAESTSTLEGRAGAEPDNESGSLKPDAPGKPVEQMGVPSNDDVIKGSENEDLATKKGATDLGNNDTPADGASEGEKPKVVEEETEINKGSEAAVPEGNEATIVSRYGTFDRALYEAAPFSMEDAAKLQNGQIVFTKDELGNVFCMGKDDNGNAFRMTVGTNFTKTGTSYGSHTWIDVPEDNPHYGAVKGYLLECKDDFARMHAEMDTQSERDGYINEIMQKIKNHDFEIVKAEDLGKDVPSAGNAGNDIETAVSGKTPVNQTSATKGDTQTTGDTGTTNTTATLDVDKQDVLEDAGDAVIEIHDTLNGDEGSTPTSVTANSVINNETIVAQARNNMETITTYLGAEEFSDVNSDSAHYQELMAQGKYKEAGEFFKDTYLGGESSQDTEKYELVHKYYELALKGDKSAAALSGINVEVKGDQFLQLQVTPNQDSPEWKTFNSEYQTALEKEGAFAEGEDVKLAQAVMDLHNNNIKLGSEEAQAYILKATGHENTQFPEFYNQRAIILGLNSGSDRSALNAYLQNPDEAGQVHDLFTKKEFIEGTIESSVQDDYFHWLHHKLDENGATQTNTSELSETQKRLAEARERITPRSTSSANIDRNDLAYQQAWRGAKDDYRA